MTRSHSLWFYVLYVYKGNWTFRLLSWVSRRCFVHVWSACMYEIDWLWWFTAVTNLFPISDWLLLFTALSSNSVPYASLIGSVSSLSSQTTTQSLYDNNSLPRFARKGLNIFVYYFLCSSTVLDVHQSTSISGSIWSSLVPFHSHIFHRGAWSGSISVIIRCHPHSFWE